jgi:hypothetical protein
MTAESLNIPKTIVLRILKEDFCSQDYFCCKIKRPHTKLCSPIFDQKKMLQPFITPHSLQIYLHQTIFCSQSWKWS